jgi:hypothetical protein
MFADMYQRKSWIAAYLQQVASEEKEIGGDAHAWHTWRRKRQATAEGEILVTKTCGWSNCNEGRGRARHLF